MITAEFHECFIAVKRFGLFGKKNKKVEVPSLERPNHQLALPEFYLMTPPEKSGESISWFYDLLGYVAERGEPIPNGDTVGVDENHRLQVEYTNSPADDGSVVWSIRV